MRPAGSWYSRALAACLATLLAGCGTPPQARPAGAADPGVSAKAGTVATGTHKGLGYRLYEPAATKPVPLVVMLHGCAQDAREAAAVTRFDELGASEGFAVLYPEQSVMAHFNRCWRWFDPDDQGRGRGEPGTIRGMVEEVAAKRPIDPGAVYITGLSAGAAMAGTVAAAYPDVFAAAGIASGLEVRAATHEAAGWAAMSLGGPDPLRLAKVLVESMGANRRIMPVMVFHGGADPVVKPVNGDQVAAQWVAIDDAILKAGGQSLAAKPAEIEEGRKPGGHAWQRESYRDSAGREQVARYRIGRMGHAWPGGAAGHAFSDPDGPDASKLLWAFFKGQRVNLNPPATWNRHPASPRRPYLGQ